MNKLEIIARTLSKGTSKKYETYCINAIYQKLNNNNLEVETQKYVEANGKRRYLDMFFPQLKIAVEIDEGYHENNRENDQKREKEIHNKMLSASIASLIKIKRIKAYNVTLEEINASIDNLVSELKELIVSYYPDGLKWLSYEDRINNIKSNKLITTDDYFYTNAEVINLVYNKNMRGFMRAGYREIWFPVLSYFKNGQLTSAKSWINYFNNNHTIIYEKSNNIETNEWKKRSALKDLEKKVIRFTFIKEKDEFGKYRKRFAGVFKADGWDPVEEAEKWKLIKTELDIPII